MILVTTVTVVTEVKVVQTSPLLLQEITNFTSTFCNSATWLCFVTLLIWTLPIFVWTIVDLTWATGFWNFCNSRRVPTPTFCSQCIGNLTTAGIAPEENGCLESGRLDLSRGGFLYLNSGPDAARLFPLFQVSLSFQTQAFHHHHHHHHHHPHHQQHHDHDMGVCV